jgi:hypothetical protein
MNRLTRTGSTAAIALLTLVVPRGLTAQTRHACDLVTSAQLAAATGRQELANARPIRSTEDQSQPGGAITAEGTGCGFQGSSITVELQEISSLQIFTDAASRRVKAGELQSYPGLGDAAWFRYNKALSQHGFIVRSGNNLVIIMMNTSEAGSAEKVKSQLLPLAQAALAKLK